MSAYTTNQYKGNYGNSIPQQMPYYGDSHMPNYAAPGTPPGMQSWGSDASSLHAAPSTPPPGHGMNLDPNARPFVHGSFASTPSNDSLGSPSTSSGKRMNNPYASPAVPVDIGSDSFEQHNQHYDQYGNQGYGSPVSPYTPPQSWNSPAAPLPTALPVRENAMTGPGHRQHRGRHNNNNSHHNSHHDNHHGHASPATPTQPVTFDDVTAEAGHYFELARTANGSSFIQSAVREGSDPRNLEFIWNEMEPALSDLLLDAHGCYVIKSIMERLPPADLQRAVATIAADPQLVFSMCTHSLHTRRVVQFLLDSMDCPFIFSLLTAHCVEIATTQQGCIVMQRAMDTSTGHVRNELFDAIYQHLTRFAMDPFANYVVQHLLEVGDKSTNTMYFREAFLPHAVELSCNKFASNVMEKALFHLDESVQHEILVRIYSSGDEILYRMLQDSFGNYLIQSSIALAAYKDVFFMSEKLRPVLQRTPYGHKIEARLDRRLKGKAVGTRSPMIGATYKAQQQGGRQHGGGHRGNHHGPNRSGSFNDSASSYTGSDEAVEEPW